MNFEFMIGFLLFTTENYIIMDVYSALVSNSGTNCLMNRSGVPAYYINNIYDSSLKPFVLNFDRMGIYIRYNFSG